MSCTVHNHFCSDLRMSLGHTVYGALTKQSNRSVTHFQCQLSQAFNNQHVSKQIEHGLRKVSNQTNKACQQAQHDGTAKRVRCAACSRYRCKHTCCVSFVQSHNMLDLQDATHIVERLQDHNRRRVTSMRQPSLRWAAGAVPCL